MYSYLIEWQECFLYSCIILNYFTCIGSKMNTSLIHHRTVNTVVNLALLFIAQLTDKDFYIKSPKKLAQMLFDWFIQGIVIHFIARN